LLFASLLLKLNSEGFREQALNWRSDYDYEQKHEHEHDVDWNE
jgi:hypothetical protein